MMCKHTTSEELRETATISYFSARDVMYTYKKIIVDYMKTPSTALQRDTLGSVKCHSGSTDQAHVLVQWIDLRG